MQKKMPIGIDDFRELMETGYYYVDKTDFIRKLLEHHSKVTLITRPRRFGKTLTLSMLDYFFSVQEGEKNARLFKDLAIEQAGRRYMRFQGQYPVLFLSLKDIKNKDWASMQDNFSLYMSNLCLQYSFLGECSRIQKPLRQRFEALIRQKAGYNELSSSLAFLLLLLQQYYGKPVILLLDEYDAPLQCAWENGFYDDCIFFMRQWLSTALKGNAALDFAVLTGVLRIAKESIFSGLNNLDVCSVLTNKYNTVMGFTQAEVEKMTRDLGCSGKMQEIQDWYDGYRFGSREIYNPWSVNQYFDAGCEPGPYWANTSNNSILRELLSHADAARIQELQGLMEGKNVSSMIDEGVIYDTIGKDDAALYTMLLMTGYLKAVRQDEIGYYDLKIPNREIRSIYQREILSNLVKGLNINRFMDFKRYLFTGQAENLTRVLENILLQMASFYDTGNGESFYHGFMLGMVSLLSGNGYTVESNRESGYGRFDLALLPESGKNPGVIMEFKAAGNEEELPEKARQALEQIQNRQYDAVFAQRKIKTVWAYGIAFYGKKVCIQRQ